MDGRVGETLAGGQEIRDQLKVKTLEGRVAKGRGRRAMSGIVVGRLGLWLLFLATTRCFDCNRTVFETLSAHFFGCN